MGDETRTLIFTMNEKKRCMRDNVRKDDGINNVINMSALQNYG